jgi:hypothetical protein
MIYWEVNEMRKGGMEIAQIPFQLAIVALLALVAVFFIMSSKEGALPLLDQVDNLIGQLIGI